MSEKYRYHKTKVYKMQDIKTGFFYMGSTTQESSKRSYEHKIDSRSKYMQVYKKFNEVGRDNVYITLGEFAKCENEAEQLRAEDSHIIPFYNDPFCLNAVRPARTRGECKEAKKKHILHYTRKYCKEHKEENQPQPAKIVERK